MFSPRNASASPRRARSRRQRPDFNRTPTIQTPALRYRSSHRVDDTTWTDRLYKENPGRFETTWQKHVPATPAHLIGQKAGPIEAFLTEYLGRAVRLCAVYHYLNSTTEFDVWRFDYSFS